MSTHIKHGDLHLMNGDTWHGY